MDAAHRTAPRDRPIARWDHSGAERFWCDLAGGPTDDLSTQFVRPADAQRSLGHWRAPFTVVDRHGDGFGAREAPAPAPQPSLLPLGLSFLLGAATCSERC